MPKQKEGKGWNQSNVNLITGPKIVQHKALEMTHGAKELEGKAI
jgi:hypothetical protein